MIRFIGSVSIKREVLVRNKLSALKVFSENFLISTKFNTKWGAIKLKETFKKNNIENNSKSIDKYLENNTKPLLSLVAIQTNDDDYEFHLINHYNYTDLSKEVDLIFQEKNISLLGKSNG